MGKLKKKKGDSGHGGLLKEESSEGNSVCVKSVSGHMTARCPLPFSPLHILERTAPVEWVGIGISHRHDGIVQQITSCRSEQVWDWQEFAPWQITVN